MIGFGLLSVLSIVVLYYSLLSYSKSRDRSVMVAAFSRLMLAAGLWSASVSLVPLVFIYSQSSILRTADLCLVYSSSIVMSYSILRFSLASRVQNYMGGKWLTFMQYLSASLVSVVALTNPESIIFVDEGSLTSNPGPFYIGFLALFLLPIFIWLYLFFEHKDRAERSVMIVQKSILWAAVPGFVANLALPYLGTFRYVWVGPAFVALVVAVSSYSVFRYGLFNMKRSSLRSAGYTLSLIILGVVYLGLVFLAVGMIFDQDIEIGVLLVAMLVAGLAAASFGPLHRLFDRVTNKLFLKDAYSTEDTLTDLSKVLTSKIDLDSIVEGSLNTIDEAIRPEYSSLVINSAELSTEIKVYGHRFSNTIAIYGLLERSPSEYNLPQLSETPPELQSAMKDADIGFSHVMKTAERTIGHIVLGQKESGSSYDVQDLSMLQIASRQMAVALENAFKYESLKDYNKRLESEVKEATKDLGLANKKLAKTNQELIDLNEKKDEFVSIAAHQLRTPLGAINGYSSMLTDGTFEGVPKAVSEVMEKIADSSSRMSFLVADLLNSGRVKSGTLKLDPERFDLSEMVSRLLTEISPVIESKDLELHIEVDKDILVYGDEQKLRQVVMNFVDNAAHYTPDDGSLTVSLHGNDRSVKFAVTDTGIGVPKKSQSKLFSKFFRAENAQEMRPDGTGIGAYLAKEIIELHKGKVIFKSKEGKGSTFGFRLPRATKAQIASIESEKTAEALARAKRVERVQSKARKAKVKSAAKHSPRTKAAKRLRAIPGVKKPKR